MCGWFTLLYSRNWQRNVKQLYTLIKQNKQKQKKTLCIHSSEGWMKIQELSQGCILPSRINPKFHRQQSDHSHPCKTALLWITVHNLKLWSTGIFNYLIVLIIETALFFSSKPLDLQDLSTPTRDWTWVLARKVQSPNHWTTKRIPTSPYFRYRHWNRWKWPR